MKKVLIVGASGTGKSTLGEKLSKRTGLPRQDLDELYWAPDWTARPVEEFRAGVEDVLEQDSWIIEGVQDAVREDVLREADTLIWIDPPVTTHFSQLARRTFNRITKGTEVCNGNTETLSNFCSSNNIFLWAYRTRKRFANELSPVFRAANDNQDTLEPPYDNIENFIRLSSREDMADFLKSVSNNNSGPGPRP